MPQLRRLGGRQVVQLFEQAGCAVVTTRGSHAKMRRVVSSGTRETLTVPLSRQLVMGTRRGIIRQASRYLSEEEFRDLFYPD